MKDRIDPLITERAPWLGGTGQFNACARKVLDKLLGYDDVIQLACRLEGEPAQDIMQIMADRLAKRVQIDGLRNVPSTGAALVVANHPTGVADGIMLWHALSQIRPDLYFFANSDILRVFPQLSTVIAPVEWRPEKRSHSKSRETMIYTKLAIDAGRLGVIFPSGRLAKRRGLALHERPWMHSAAVLAKKFGLPVVPVNIKARNSSLFYMFDRIHPTLRDITLFHETLNKDRQAFSIEIGKQVLPQSLSAVPEEATEQLFHAMLRSRECDPHAACLSETRSTRRIRSIQRRIAGIGRGRHSLRRE